jgi:hypothetical protein
VSPLASVPDVVPDSPVVTRLLREQTPRLADMPVWPSGASGSSNWVFRLGDTLAIRLPRSDDYVADLVNEVRWLPRLSPNLPVAVPDVIAVGQPSGTFPRPWAVVSWVPGDLPLALDGSQQARLAGSLGTFLQSLHAVDTADVPVEPEHWGYRCGEPVTDTIDRWANTRLQNWRTCSTQPAFMRHGSDCGRPCGYRSRLLGAHRLVRGEPARSSRRTAGRSGRLRRCWRRRSVRGPALRVEHLRRPGSRGAPRRVRGR